ncbi:hypothetical protein CBR_g34586 [Chara braunii]|uniref:t-SNARE coiled-coil homology domain-containing protein n=1 Tax=Chara braunii TaxID=69332 RepID=A0A388LJA4_CHABU|nr:hypothetical protein CBR_g34586 [Chara braunii]|eukprot:GBG82302.1 hypothetical protein CBR_g34586 [Chara braunii]
MNDLLQDFRAERGLAMTAKNDGDDRMDPEQGGGAPPPPAPDNRMSEFFEEVAEVKNVLASIRRNLHKLQDAHEESKLVTRADSFKALKERMESDIDEVSRLAHGIKTRLEQLDKKNEANRSLPGCGEGSSTDRTRVSITATLKKKLKELMAEFQTLRQRFNDDYREVVKRRYFTGAILLFWYLIFLDMAVLVEAQGEMLDNIETQVSRAVDHVQSGTNALQKAKASQKSTRKWMCCAIIILLIIIIIIVVSVLKPWRTGKA